jgi:hypothetical protein
MGDRSFSPRSSGLRLLLRLVSMVAALWVLCLSGHAAAATVPASGTTAVPMCGERNQSIEAPPIFRVDDSGVLRAMPCHGPDEFAAGQGAPSGPKRVVVHERAEQVLPFRALCLTQAASSRLGVTIESQAPRLPGFVATLFRPPQA